MSDESLTTGRHIRLEPLRPGMWGVILGVVVGGLAPLGGFLVGSILGVGDPGAAVNPMYLALFVGIVIGALGVAVAIANVYRMLRRRSHEVALPGHAHG